MKPILSLDIETSGLSPWTDKIFMCGLYDGKQYTCVRQGHQLRNLLGTLYKDHDLVGQNSQFDIKFLLVQQGWLTRPDLEGRTIHDTKILGSLVRNRVPKEFLDRYEVMRKEVNKSLPHGVSHREGSYLSLKVMAPWYLKVPPFWETPGAYDNEDYNMKDCLYTYKLYQLLAPRVRAEGSWEFYMKMLGWSEMIREMEIRGISIDLKELDKVEAEYTEKRNYLKNKLDELWADARGTYQADQEIKIINHYDEMKTKALAKAKDINKCLLRYGKLTREAMARIEPFNYSSPKQMAWLLKDYLGLDITNMEGEDSTGKAVLNKLAQDGREDIKTYLEWREADKVLTMYVPTYRELQVNGVIHPSFNLTGTRTGRTSSSSPNLQQVPSKLYRLFRPRPGFRFIQYDLSGIEAALIALYSGDKRLYEILEKGESIHDHNAKAMFGLECAVSEISTKHPRERKTVKNIGFACFYGAGWKRISQVFAAGGFPISDNEAKEKLKLLKSYYPEVFTYHKKITEDFEQGKTVINALGRPINLQPHDNPYMQGFNTLIQSSASDLNIEACYEFWEPDADPQPLLVIHDCIVAEAPSNQSGEAAYVLKHVMTNFKLESINGPIQLRVEGGVNDHWAK